MTDDNHTWLLAAFGVVRCVIDRLMALTDDGRKMYSGRFECELPQFNPRTVVHGLHQLRQHGIIDFRGVPNIGGRDIWVLPAAAAWLRMTELPAVDARGQLSLPRLSPHMWRLYGDLRALTKDGTIEFFSVLGKAIGRRVDPDAIDTLTRHGMIESQLLSDRKTRRVRVLKLLDESDVIISLGNVPRGTEGKPQPSRMQPGQDYAPRADITRARLIQQNAAFDAVIRAAGGRFEDAPLRRKIELRVPSYIPPTTSPITCTAAMAAI